MRKLIYVAGPYRGSSSWDVEQNIRQAETIALAIWRTNNACLCPHTNNRFYEKAAPDEVWLAGDLEMMVRCDAVLMTPDFERSSGARAERDRCLELGIPVFYATEVSADPLRLPQDLITYLNSNIQPIYESLVNRLTRLKDEG